MKGIFRWVEQMRRERNIKYLWLLLLAVQPASAQVDSLADLVPLEEGNRWTYSWYDAIDNRTSGKSHSGTVDYIVVDKRVTADSIRWVIFARRSFTNLVGGQYYPTVDSLTFALVEQLDGGGDRLYWDNGSDDPLAFAFYQSFRVWSGNAYVDSVLFYRYGFIDSTGSAVRDFYANGNGHFHYRFMANVGLDSLVAGGMDVTETYWSRRAS
jgi:hypothetical protein